MGDAAAVGGQEQGQQGQRQGFFTLGNVARMFILYYFLSSTLLRKPDTQANNPKNPTTIKEPPIYPLMRLGDDLEFRLYLSQEENFELQRLANFEKAPELKWREKVRFGESFKLNKTFVIDIDGTELQNNGSLYAHIHFNKVGFSPLPSSPNFSPNYAFSLKTNLVRYRPLRRKAPKKNLISGEVEEVKREIPENETQIIVSYWKPNLVIELVNEDSAFPPGTIPPQLMKRMNFGPDGNYYPSVFLNDFWHLKEKEIPINDTLKNLTLEVEFGHTSLLMWQLLEQMEESFTMQRSWQQISDSESDELRRMLLETNPYLLAVTFCVTILHSIFDFLAFKNDIAFWKNRKSMEGLSVRTILLNSICHFIIFLYLLDNDTSWVILISNFVGLLIEFWKVQKAMILKISWRGFIPMIHLEDRVSYVSKTKQFDDQAHKYISWVLYPLIVCYAIYSLLYQSHKSWYSWVLSSLVGTVYTFGFIMMTPQLMINYQMKSVSHLPWRVLVYKALNTFIDDLFAFIIRMPTMHRLSCFRDDIIFFIYLYQRWIYPVDKKRTYIDDEEEEQANAENKEGVVAVPGEVHGNVNPPEVADGKEKTE